MVRKRTWASNRSSLSDAPIYTGKLTGSISRTCPTCEAKPGMKCVRWMSKANYQVTLKKYHETRRTQEKPEA